MLPVILFCGLAIWGAWNTHETLSRLQQDYLRNQALLTASSIEGALRHSYIGGPLSQSSDTNWINDPNSEEKRRKSTFKDTDKNSPRSAGTERKGNPRLGLNGQKVQLRGSDEEIWSEKLDSVLSDFALDSAEICVINSARQILYHTEPQRRGKILDDPDLEAILQARKLYQDRVLTREGKSFYQLLLPYYAPVAAKHQSEGASAADPLVIMVSLETSIADFILYPGKINLALVGIACIVLLILWFVSRKYFQRFLVLRNREAEQGKWTLLGQMAATLAHEIRNPLGAVKGLAQLLREGRQSTENQRQYLGVIVEESQRLEKLVSDLLLFAKPVSPEKREFELDSLMEDLRLFFLPEMEKNQIHFEYSPKQKATLFLGDYELMRRVLINLIENALQAMPEGGRLRIESEIRPDGLSLKIEDEGTGIPADSGQLFEPFFTTKAAGTGLGLAISRQIVSAMKGDLVLEKRAEKGTRCIVNFPA